MFGRDNLTEWPLDPALTYLNHGTVGVTPRRILAIQQGIRDEIERQPSRFLLRELTRIVVGQPRPETPRLREAAEIVAAFLGARGDDLVFVDNATTGANAVLRSFPLMIGDEILVTDLGYGGVTQAAIHAARERGATVRSIAMPYPVGSGGDLVDACVAAIGPHTRLAILDHITSESALVFPLAEIAAQFRARGVAVLADGAHAPGAIALDITALGVDWYVANLHKWMWVPRSSGILWASPERQHGLHPVVISWGLDQGFTTEFDSPGTRDPSAHLSAPHAVALMQQLGVDAVHAYNHRLAWDGAQRLADRFGSRFDTPRSMIGTMATVPLPEPLGSTRADAAALRDRLLFEDGIEVAVHASRDRLHARICGQIYNDMGDIERLADAVGRKL
ncbi:MAG: aminotransferase class V-fold PLP-dependent enzyme [Acidobacteriota bacterium]